MPGDAAISVLGINPKENVFMCAKRCFCECPDSTFTVLEHWKQFPCSAIGWIKPIVVKMSASCSNMIKSHNHSIHRQEPDIKKSKLQEAQKQAAVSYRVRNQDKVALGEERRGTETFLGAGNVAFF